MTVQQEKFQSLKVLKELGSFQVKGDLTFILSLMPMLGVVFSELVYFLVFKVQRKTSDYVIFYGSLIACSSFIFYFIRNFTTEYCIKAGKVQAIFVLLGFIIWSFFSKFNHALLVLNGWILIISLLVTLPALLKKNIISLPLVLERNYWDCFTALLICATYNYLFGANFKNLSCGIGLGILGVVVSWLISIFPFRFDLPRGLYLYFLVILVISFLDLSFQVDLHHESFYLGPILQFLSGRDLYLYTDSQYGLGVIWFYGIIFKLLGRVDYTTLDAIEQLLTILHFLGLVWIIRKLGLNRLNTLFAALVLGVFLIAAWWPISYSHPSQGTSRFGFFVFLYLAAQLKIDKRENRNAIEWFEAFIVMVSLFWSVDVAVFIVFSYSVLLIYEGRVFVRLLKTLSMFIVSFIAIQLAVYLHSGHLFPYQRLVEYARIYVGNSGIMVIPIDLFSPTAISTWLILMVGIVILIKGYLDKEKDSRLCLFVSAAFVGLSYYLNRSTPSQFYLESAAFVLIVIFVIYKVIPLVYRSRAIVALGAAVGFWLYCFQTPFVIEPLRVNSKFLLDPSKIRANTSVCDIFKNDIEFIKRIEPGNSAIKLLVTTPYELVDTPILVCLNRPNYFDLSPAVMTTISEIAVNRKLSYLRDHPLSVGDILFIEYNLIDPTGPQIYKLQGPRNWGESWIGYLFLKEIEKSFRLVAFAQGDRLMAYKIVKKEAVK